MQTAFLPYKHHLQAMTLAQDAGPALVRLKLQRIGALVTRPFFSCSLISNHRNKQLGKPNLKSSVLIVYKVEIGALGPILARRKIQTHTIARNALYPLHFHRLLPFNSAKRSLPTIILADANIYKVLLYCTPALPSRAFCFCRARLSTLHADSF